jgi:hypothetical protein
MTAVRVMGDAPGFLPQTQHDSIPAVYAGAFDMQTLLFKAGSKVFLGMSRRFCHNIVCLSGENKPLKDIAIRVMIERRYGSVLG